MIGTCHTARIRPDVLLTCSIRNGPPAIAVPGGAASIAHLRWQLHLVVGGVPHLPLHTSTFKPLLGLHAAIKPLFSHSTTGEFNSPPKSLRKP
eukprot:5629329-Pyramimonas_sp.AAC.3